MWPRLVNVAVGVWLMAAPAVLGYAGRMEVNDRVVGPLAATFAAIAIWEVTRPVRWVNLAFGAWMLLSPWALGASWASALNATATGLVLAAFAAWEGGRTDKIGGGWSALMGPGDPWLELRPGDNSPEPSRPKVAVVTGASAGVGRATAIAFAEQGWSVGLIARGRAGLDGARRDVERAGGRAHVVQADTSDAEAIEKAATEIERELGPIDVWVNDAMLSVFSPVREMQADEYRRVTEVTYLGYVHGTLAALRRMLPRDRGVIVQVGSALAYRGIPLQSAYCASKHAIQGFDDSLRAELYHDGSRVRVASVEMPALNTPQFGWVKSRLPNQGQPVPPIFQPEVAARGILYAATHRVRELYVGFPTFKAIVGNKLVPGYADRALGRSGYKSQQTDQPRDPNQPNNLWSPVDQDEDHGAHGAFDARAQSSSRMLWVVTHFGPATRVAAGVAAAACLIAAFLLRT